MRISHSFEEKLYSPTLKLTGSEYKILLYLRHSTVRWDQESDEFSYTQISKNTGIGTKEARMTIKSLMKKKLILVVKRCLNNRYFKNSIGLDPAYWGELIEPTCRPKLSIVRENNAEKLSTVGGPSPLGVGGCSPSGVGGPSPLLNPRRSAPEADFQAPKELSLNNINLLKNKKIEESFTLSESEAEEIQRAKEYCKSFGNKSLWSMCRDGSLVIGE